MIILEKMKKDINSVVGLYATEDVNGNMTNSIIKSSRIQDYSWTNIDDERTTIHRYQISFDGLHYVTISDTDVCYRD